MRVLTVRGLNIGEGIPKICVPITGAGFDTIVNSAIECAKMKPDIFEWRADYFHELGKDGAVLEVLKVLRKIIEDKPLIFTVRSREEGGEASLSAEAYNWLIQIAAGSETADIVDIELSKGDTFLMEAISQIHKNKKNAILSTHNFLKTPANEEFLTLVSGMKKTSADIFKIAVMIKSHWDVGEVFRIMSYMNENCHDRPFAVMGMGELGVLSRIGGGFAGSSLTFAKGTVASAPGQISVNDMRKAMNIIYHES